MSKIVIEVKDSKLSKVMTLLESMSPELIQSVSLQKGATPVKSSLNKSNNQGKYMSRDAYKNKVQEQPVLEDEFLAGKSSSGKYVNPSEYKKRLNK